MKGLTGIAIFGASVIGVMLVAPLVLTAADRITGGRLSGALEATVGRAQEEIAGVQPEEDIGLFVDPGQKAVSGARLVRLQ